MLLLDTNVLSALIEPLPPAPVRDWIVGQRRELLVTAATCQAEILAGLAIMPRGRRRRGLERAAHMMFSEDFGGRVPPFNSPAAKAYAHIFAIRRRAGRPVAEMDLMIAAIALAHDADIVTRNVADFEGCGVALINPWD